MKEVIIYAKDQASEPIKKVQQTADEVTKQGIKNVEKQIDAEDKLIKAIANVRKKYAESANENKEKDKDYQKDENLQKKVLEKTKLDRQRYDKEKLKDKEKTAKEEQKILEDNAKKEVILARKVELEKQNDREKFEKTLKRAGRRVVGVGETGINQSIMGIGTSLSSGDPFSAIGNAGGAIGSSAAGLIPYIGGIVGTAVSAVTQVFTSAIHAAKAIEVPKRLLSNLTGQGAGGGLSFMTSAELMAQIIPISKQRGRRGAGEITNQLQFERGTGYNSNELFGGINKFTNMLAPDNSMDSIIKKFFNIAAGSKLWNVEKGDFTNMGNVINQTLTPLLQREADISEVITGEKASAVAGTFAMVKDGFEDNRAGQRIAAIDQAIRNPGNEFLDNFVKSAILKNNPKANLENIIDIQAQGIMNIQTFATILEDIKAGFGKDASMALMKFIPSMAGNPEMRKNLLEKSYLFSQNLTSEQIAKKMGGKTTKKEIDEIIAKAGAAPQEEWEKAINALMTKFGEILVEKLLPILIKIFNAIEKLYAWFTRIQISGTEENNINTIKFALRDTEKEELFNKENIYDEHEKASIINKFQKLGERMGRGTLKLGEPLTIRKAIEGMEEFSYKEFEGWTPEEMEVAQKKALGYSTNMYMPKDIRANQSDLAKKLKLLQESSSFTDNKFEYKPLENLNLEMRPTDITENLGEKGRIDYKTEWDETKDYINTQIKDIKYGNGDFKDLGKTMEGMTEPMINTMENRLGGIKEGGFLSNEDQKTITELITTMKTLVIQGKFESNNANLTETFRLKTKK